MKKFTNLLVKEIRDLINKQLIISLVFTVFMFTMLGGLAKKEAKKAAATQKISVMDLDKSAPSQSLIARLAKADFKIDKVTADDVPAAVTAARAGDTSLLVVIPAGFGDSVGKMMKTEIRTYTFLRSFSMGSMRKTEIVKALINAVNDYVSDDFLKAKVPGSDPNDLKNPIKTREFVDVNGRTAEGSAAAISGFVYAQSVFVPVILMMIIIYSSQMVISAIAMEKQNKTLETLLTVPVKRTAIVSTKMLAAGLVGLLTAVIYMGAFKAYMGGMAGDLAPAKVQLASVMKELGLAMSSKGYAMLGLSLFFAILCALAMATVLGVLAEDFRGAQSLLMPIMFMVMVPYFLTIFSDLSTMSLPVKLLILLIPFSHPFLASQNIILGHYQSVFYGIIYMAVVFLGLVILAARIFSTDRVLTMKLRLKHNKAPF